MAWIERQRDRSTEVIPGFRWLEAGETGRDLYGLLAGTRLTDFGVDRGSYNWMCIFP